ncbi:MAG: 4-hydroxy-tetrahydrodipicolinate reductase [Nitrospiria bacterium]
MKIIVSGSAGRMGRAILESLYQEDDLELGAALEKKGHPAIKKDVGTFIGIGNWGIAFSLYTKKTLLRGDVVVDFTYPQGTIKMVQESKAKQKPMVIGTTGFTREDHGKIEAAAKKIPIVLSPNMSVGVNVMFKLISDATQALGEAYDVEILEIHHRQKKDAPSGTAIRLGEVVAASRKTSLQQVGRFARQGNIGVRNAGEIGLQSLRAGDVVGDHTVTFAGLGERIELTHRAHHRNNFARGALMAARWIVNQAPGLYDMMDVLNLK